MQRDTDRFKLFTRRTLLLGGAQVALLGGLIVRLYQLQVVEAPKYAVLADDNRINLRLLPPIRGLIYDRAGVPLAINRQNYRALLISEKTGNAEATLDRLDLILNLGDNERRRVMRELQRNRSFVPVVVRENLTWDEVSQIEFNTPDLPGISIDVGQLRDYPMGESLAHILGYVSAVTEKELRDDSDPVLSLPGFRTGKKGIENSYEKQLRGRAGNVQVEVNSVGRTIRELSRTEGQAGANLVLTIDSELQNFTYNRLKDESAACVVLDVQNGDVLALVSTPSYDPNPFVRGLTNTEWQDLLNNPRTPLNNKAITGQYPPGSTFKLMTAIAGLESGAITPSTNLPCAGVVQLGDTKFHCWLRGGHGSVNLNLGLAQSCDCYFYEVAKRAGVDKIAEVAQRFGLGEELGINIPGEKPGLVPTRQWKQATLGQPWTQGETLVFGIGQGYMQATPLQLAVMVARIANGGFAVTPRLLRDPAAPASQTPQTARAAAMFPKMKMNADNLKQVIAGMDAVTNSQRGTAYGARIVDPEMAMAGKTGTAQVKRITQADRDAGPKKIADIPWNLRHHALFVAFAPVGNPRYACAVIIEHGVGGASTAAPVARDVLLECQKRDPSATPPKSQVASLSPQQQPPGTTPGSH